jgi:hypothetical protein
MRTRQLIVWFAIGLLGLALAAGVTYAATQLSSQRIGLSAEPPSAGEELAPRHARTRTTVRTTTLTVPVAPPGSTATEPPQDRGAGEYRPRASGDGDHDLDD